jgi:hypothetical protein
VKSRVVAKLKTVLDANDSNDAYPEIKLSERRRTAQILRDTGVL